MITVMFDWLIAVRIKELQAKEKVYLLMKDEKFARNFNADLYPDVDDARSEEDTINEETDSGTINCYATRNQFRRR